MVTEAIHGKQLGPVAIDTGVDILKPELTKAAVLWERRVEKKMKLRKLLLRGASGAAKSVSIAAE